MNILQIGSGAMGKLLAPELEQAGHQVTVLDNSKKLPDEKFDALIDFSHPDNLANIINYLNEKPTPIVIATTGFSAQQEQSIQDLSEKMPVLYSSNFSVGVTLMNRLVREMTAVLADDFDIEIIEKHHNKKIDAPSGTAKTLLSNINQSLNYQVTYGRSGVQPREKKEIGVHAVRGGTIVGEHEVIFAGQDEIISVKHEAHSKMIFVRGAVKGVSWIAKQNNGIYNMEDVLFKG